MSKSESQGHFRIGVIGGGVAGMAATLAALRARWSSDAAVEVTLLERSRFLGGRASSIRFTGSDIDPARNATAERGSDLTAESPFPFLADAGQHLFLDACSALRTFHDELGLTRFFDRQPTIPFLFPPTASNENGPAVWRFFAAPFLPGPFKFLPTLARMTFLSARERLHLIRTVRRLTGGLIFRERVGETDEPFDDFLLRSGVSFQTRSLFWDPILLSALGERAENISTRAARKVFREGIFAAAGPVLSIPNRPLRVIYHDAAFSALTRLGASVRFFAKAARLLLSAKGAGNRPAITGVVLDDGRSLSFDRIITAIPSRATGELLRRSGLVAEADALGVERFRPGAITAVHLWLRRRLISERAAVLTGSPGQWLFVPGADFSGIDRSSAPSPFSEKKAALVYHQILLSGSHRILTDAERKPAALFDAVDRQLSAIFPDFRPDEIIERRQSTVPDAIFLPVPELFSNRPTANIGVDGLRLAGDWTATGWPATLEGAVRSGLRAAEP